MIPIANDRSLATMKNEIRESSGGEEWNLESLIDSKYDDSLEDPEEDISGF